MQVVSCSQRDVLRERLHPQCLFKNNCEDSDPKPPVEVLGIVSHQVEEENHRPEDLSKSVGIYYMGTPTARPGSGPRNALPEALCLGDFTSYGPAPCLSHSLTGSFNLPPGVSSCFSPPSPPSLAPSCTCRINVLVVCSSALLGLAVSSHVLPPFLQTTCMCEAGILVSWDSVPRKAAFLWL